jgi:hypothetical protein
MSVVQRTAAMAIVLSGLLLGSALPARADRHEECESRIHKAEWNLRRAVERHGEGSPQADFRRHQLEEIREHCRDHRDHDERREEHREQHEEHEEHEHGY